MTGLDERAIVRVTNVPDTTRSGRRPLVVRMEIGGKLLRIRPRGTKRWFTIDFMSIYREAVRIRAREIRDEKKAARAARKSGG